MRSCTRRSRMATSSACCSAALSPAFDGQSMLSTVATQTARSSWATGGGAVRARGGGSAGEDQQGGETGDAKRHGGDAEVRRRGREHSNDAWRRSGATFV